VSTAAVPIDREAHDSSPAPLWRSALVGVAALVLYLLLLQPQPHGDGVTYIWFIQHGKLLGHHLLYLPMLASFAWLVEPFGVDARSASFLFSAVCAGGAVFLFDRLIRSAKALCPAQPGSILPTLLFALSSATLFFATTAENHAHHLFWCAALLLTLDRVLGSDPGRRGRLALWPLATLLLLAVYTSHSSSLLLWPALLLWLHGLGGRLLRLPSLGEVLRALVFFAPVLLFKFGEPWIKARVLGGGDEYLADGHTQFALGLLDWRDLGTWARYLTWELLLPLGAVLLAGALAWRGKRLAVALLALLPYLLFFGHWNVYEYGAYYLAPLPVLILLLAASWAQLKSPLRFAVLVLLLGTGAYGVHNVLTYATRDPQAEWFWARDLQEITTPQSTVIVWHGYRAFTLMVDTKIDDVLGLENWWVFLEPHIQAHGLPALEAYIKSRMPELWPIWTREGRGPVFVGDKALHEMEAKLPPLLTFLRKHADWSPIEHGIVRGHLLRAR
jgi:hypothetical protein